MFNSQEAVDDVVDVVSHRNFGGERRFELLLQVATCDVLAGAPDSQTTDRPRQASSCKKCRRIGRKF